MIFVDTWAWLALANPQDSAHSEAVRFYRSIKQDQLLTTDYVLDELLTALFRHLPFQQSLAFAEAVLEKVELGQMILEPIDRDRFREAWALRQKYQDKPDISFTDLTSFVVMRELGIKQAFTKDRHFEQVNMGFTLRPS